MHFNTNKDLKEYQLHWMTITEMNCNKSSDTYIATVSSWGRIKQVDFKEAMNDSTYAGVIYFK